MNTADARGSLALNLSEVEAVKFWLNSLRADDQMPTARGTAESTAARIRKPSLPWQHVPVNQHAFSITQSWEGRVERVDERGIHVRLFDQTNPNNDDELATLDRDRIDADDLPLVKPGAVFYWRIGYEKHPSGFRSTGFIRFRRMPAWRQRDLDAASEAARELEKRIASG